MNEAFNAIFQFNKCAVIGDVGHLALDLGANREFLGDDFPWVFVQLLHTQRDALCIWVDTHDLHLHALANGEYIRRMVHALPCNVSDVEKTVNTAQINKCAVISDVLYNAFNHLAFSQIADQFRTLFSAGFFHDGAPRDNDVATLTVHFQNLERLGYMHQRANITNGAHVNLAAWQESHSTAKINREATLHAAKDNAINAFSFGGHFFKAHPSFFALGFFAAEHGFTQGIFNALKKNFNDAANFNVGFFAGLGKIFEWNAAFGLQANVNNDEFIFNGKNLAFDNRAL